MTATLDVDLDVVADPALGKEVYDLDRAHVFHSWSAQDLIKPLPIAGAKGSWVWDYDGKKYLDLSCQLVNTNIGHQHPKLVAAIQEHAAKLCTIAPQHANHERGVAAKMITELAGGHFHKVFFTNAGAEAAEYAIRMARLHTGRNKILTRYRSYHGGTAAAVNLTGDPRRWPNEFGIAGVVHFHGPFLYRTAFHATTQEEECERALAHLQSVVELEGPSTIAAIALESVPGTAGIMVPPPGYLRGVREICDRYGIVMIVDEVMAGFGRTGSWFAFQQHDVMPDLIAFAKGVTSGYIPLGGVVISDSIAETFGKRVFPGGLTYSGHPLACATAVASMNIMKEEGIIENAARIGREVLGPGLRELVDKHPSLGEVRGVGVFWALELVRNKQTREPLVPYAATGEANAPMVELGATAREVGFLPMIAMNRLHVVPPCIVTDDEARLGIEMVDQALSSVDKYAA
jgi:taurine--2-oxoglutarate transaminase